MRNYKIAFCLFLFTCASYGQSLGDVAREQRQKQQAKDPKAAPKVVTNEEIPESPDASTDSSDDTAGSARLPYAWPQAPERRPQSNGSLRSRPERQELRRCKVTWKS